MKGKQKKREKKKAQKEKKKYKRKENTKKKNLLSYLLYISELQVCFKKEEGGGKTEKKRAIKFHILQRYAFSTRSSIYVLI